MEKEKINGLISLFLILGILILSFLVLKPILFAIIFGVLLAYVLRPLFNKVNKKIKRKNLTAILFVLILLILILLPLASMGPAILRQTFVVYNSLQEFELGQTLHDIFPLLVNEEMIYPINLNLNNLLNQGVNVITQNITNILVNFTKVLLQIFVTFFVFFFAIRDYEKLIEYISKLSPFSSKTGKRFSKEFREITNAVLLGQVLVGVIQGLIMGVGFLILGFDNVLTLTLASMIFGIIPIIGPWIVWVPVAIFSVVQGNIFAAIFLFLYGGIFVSNIDNLIRPYFLSRTSSLPVSISLIGTVGGLYYFGIIGLFLGPLILAYALIILNFYQEGRLSEIIGGKV